MKFVKVLLSSLVVLMVCTAFTQREKGIYMVGVSASFSDSLVYFTDIQFVDSVKLDKKSKLLPLREQYSEQLDDYLEQVKGMGNRTSFIYFNKKRSKLEKLVNKMKENYNKGGKSILRETGSDFKFSKAAEY